MKGSRSMRECDKFLSKLPSIRDESACWIWRGTDHGNGYGVFWHEMKNVYAHRYSYEFFIGPIPSGMVIDHLCVNTRCVNPYHLEPVTNEENVVRQGKRTTVCKKGHPLTPGNVYLDNRGWRSCKECARSRWLETYHKNREVINARRRARTRLTRRSLRKENDNDGR